MKKEKVIIYNNEGQIVKKMKDGVTTEYLYNNVGQRVVETNGVEMKLHEYVDSSKFDNDVKCTHIFNNSVYVETIFYKYTRLKNQLIIESYTK